MIDLFPGLSGIQPIIPTKQDREFGEMLACINGLNLLKMLGIPRRLFRDAEQLLLTDQREKNDEHQ